MIDKGLYHQLNCDLIAKETHELIEEMMSALVEADSVCKQHAAWRMDVGNANMIPENGHAKACQKIREALTLYNRLMTRDGIRMEKS